VETFSQNVTAKTMVVHYVTSAMLNTQIKETPRINHPSQHVLLVLFSWQNDPRGNGNVFYFKKKEGRRAYYLYTSALSWILIFWNGYTVAWCQYLFLPFPYKKHIKSYTIHILERKHDRCSTVSTRCHPEIKTAQH